jgi:hypothetical protein
VPQGVRHLFPPVGRMRGLGGTPLRPPPYVLQQATPDERATRPDDSPVPPEAASRGRIPASHVRLGRECSATSTRLDAEVPKTLCEPGGRRFPQLSRICLHQPAGETPEVAHDPKDELFTRDFGYDRKGNRSDRGLPIGRSPCNRPAA